MGFRSLVEKFTFWHVDVALLLRISIAACSNVVIWWFTWLICAYLRVALEHVSYNELCRFKLHSPGDQCVKNFIVWVFLSLLR
jgi:hypothetical protein